MSKLFLVKEDKFVPEFKIINKKETVAEILIYGAVGEDPWSQNAVSAKQFSDELRKLPASVNEIHLRINSPGGSVFDGMAIYERLKQHKAKVITYVDGVAASIASVIALAGDEVNIGEGGFFMIHKPMSFTFGNDIEHERTIDILQRIEDQMIGIYTKRTNLTRSELLSMLKQDTWINSDESVKYGFATAKIESGEQLRMAACMLKDASWIKNAPEIKHKEINNKVLEFKNNLDNFLARK